MLPVRNVSCCTQTALPPHGRAPCRAPGASPVARCPGKVGIRTPREPSARQASRHPQPRLPVFARCRGPHPQQPQGSPACHPPKMRTPSMGQTFGNCCPQRQAFLFFYRCIKVQRRRAKEAGRELCDPLRRVQATPSGVNDCTDRL